jgi:hypothetical protein
LTFRVLFISANTSLTGAGPDSLFWEHASIGMDA